MTQQEYTNKISESFEPQSNNYFDVEIFSPNVDTDRLHRTIHRISYNQKNSIVSLSAFNDSDGNIDTIIGQLKDNPIEVLIIKTHSNNYIVSCLFGKIVYHHCDFDISNLNTEISRHELKIRFFDIRTIQKDSVFNEDSFIDQIHRKYYEKFMFEKI